MSEPKYYLAYEYRRALRLSMSDEISAEMAWNLYHKKDGKIDHRLAKNSEVPLSIHFLLYYRYKKNIKRFFIYNRETIKYKLHINCTYFINNIKFRLRLIKRSILSFFRNLWQ